MCVECVVVCGGVCDACGVCDVCGVCSGVRWCVCVCDACGVPIFAHFKVCVVDMLKDKRRSSGLKQKRSHSTH